MKLDAIKFGTLVAFVCRTSQHEHGMDDCDIRVLAGMVEDFIPRPASNPELLAEAFNKAVTNYAAVGKIIAYIKNGQKIEAIKEYRALTGIGLKEAKDAVELVLEPHLRPHQLGDILNGGRQACGVSGQ